MSNKPDGKAEKGETISAMHKGIEFSKTLKGVPDSYIAGAGFGYSCGYQDGLAASTPPADSRGGKMVGTMFLQQAAEDFAKEHCKNISPYQAMVFGYEAGYKRLLTEGKSAPLSQEGVEEAAKLGAAAILSADKHVEKFTGYAKDVVHTGFYFGFLAGATWQSSQPTEGVKPDISQYYWRNREGNIAPVIPESMQEYMKGEGQEEMWTRLVTDFGKLNKLNNIHEQVVFLREMKNTYTLFTSQNQKK